MDDLISRNKLQQNRPEWLNENCVGREEHNKGWNACNEMWLKTIAEQPTVELPTWIPCSERMPENYETVNITWVNRSPVSYYEHIKNKPFTGTAVFHYGKWYWYSCVCEDYLSECGDSTCDRMDEDIEVIAWQPLPEPYKGE